jgi:hypothetical protein
MNEVTKEEYLEAFIQALKEQLMKGEPPCKS